ncbi:hypothetical protein PWT90_10934 [Aphanocladium album]|nr:hypothetical protein PWT90_10934 [Aphanocladium album]
MSIRISLTVPSLAAASVVISAAGGVDGVTDFSSSSVSLDDTTGPNGVNTEIEAANQQQHIEPIAELDGGQEPAHVQLVSEASSSDQGTHSASHRDEKETVAEMDCVRQSVCDPVDIFNTLDDEEAADAYAAEQGAMDAYDAEWIDSLMSMAGVNDDEETLHSFRPWDETETSPSAAWNDNGATSLYTKAQLWEMLQNVSRELQDAKESNYILRLQNEEVALKNEVLETAASRSTEANRVLKQALHEAQGRIASLRSALDEVGVDKLALVVRLGRSREKRARLKLQLEEALTKVNSLRQDVTSAAIASCDVLRALDGEEFELAGTRRAMQELRTANTRLIWAIQRMETEMEAEGSC